MKKALRYLSALLTLISLSVSSYATHTAGGNFTYTYIGPNTYHLQLNLYRDCTGNVQLGLTQNVTASSSCGQVSVVLQLRPGTGVGNFVSGTPCAQFTTCYEEHIFEGTLTLPTACADWNISWQQCCRNNVISNLNLPGNQQLHLNATLNNIVAPTNSSPSFTFHPIQAFCANQEYFFDWGIFEPDGNTLVFSFASPMQVNGTPVNFGGTYTASCPFPTNPPCSMTIDPNTGIIHFIPSQVGAFVFAILVEEYDANGILIGSIIRDIQINVIGTCVLLEPTPISSIAYDPNDPTKGIYLDCDDTTFIFTFDTSVVKVQCGSVASDGSDFRLIGPGTNPQLAPIISAVPINCINGLLGEVLLTLYEPLKKGTYELNIKVGNDGNTLVGECGFAVDEEIIALVIVEDPSILMADTLSIDCNTTTLTLAYPEGFDCSTLSIDESDFMLVDENGNQYPITSITAPDCINNQEYGYQLELIFDFGGNIPDSLYLLAITGSDNNTIANRCGNFSPENGELAIIDVNGFIPMDIGQDFNLCDFEPFPVLDAGVTATNYSWTHNFDPTVLGTNQTFQPNSSGTYIIVASYQSCVGSDTIQIFVTPSPPIDLGPDVTYCTGTVPQDLDATFTGASTYNWTLDGTPLSTQPVVTPGQTGLYVVEVNVGAQCLGYDSVYISFVQQLTLTIAGTDTLCPGETGSLDVSYQGPDPDTYQWTFNGNPVGGNSQTLTVNEGGIYSVVVNTAAGCTGTQDFNVISADYPATPTISCVSVENGTYTYEWMPVPNATTYQVSLDGGISWIDPSPGPTGTQHQTSTLSNVIVQAFNDTKCSPGPVSLSAICIMDELLEIIIPNVITPSNDDLNDAFFIRNLIQYPDNNIKIFNRWGKLVYEKDSYGLDGYWWTGGEDLSGGVYFYVINLKDGVEPMKGTVTVIK